MGILDRLRGLFATPAPAPAAQETLSPKWVGRVCDPLAHKTVILSDGRLNSCCFEAEGKNCFGQLGEGPGEIPASELTQAFVEAKRRFSSDPEFMPYCKGCSNEVHLYESDFGVADRIKAFVDRSLDGINVEVTSRCNAYCSGCIHGFEDVDALRGGKRDLAIEDVKRYLDPFVSELEVFFPYTYTEPFLFKQLPELCAWVRERNPTVQIQISTNGSAFGSEKRIEAAVRSGITELEVSIHGATKEISAKYMGERTPFHAQIEGVRRFIKVRDRLGFKFPKVLLKSVLFEWNDSDEQIAAFRALGEELGADGVLFYAAAPGSGGSKKYTPGSEALAEIMALNPPRCDETIKDQIALAQAAA